MLEIRLFPSEPLKAICLNSSNPYDIFSTSSREYNGQSKTGLKSVFALKIRASQKNGSGEFTGSLLYMELRH